MSAATGVYYSVAILLGVGGALKLRRPARAARALSLLSVPMASPGLVRVVGAVEVAIGCACLLTSSVVAAFALAAVYVTLAVFVFALLLAGHRSVTCGCFGDEAVPVFVWHGLVNAACATVAALVALHASGPVSLIDALQMSVLRATLLGGMAIVAAGCLYLVLAVLPLAVLARPAEGGDGRQLIQVVRRST